jgi:hypothetical protein
MTREFIENLIITEVNSYLQTNVKIAKYNKDFKDGSGVKQVLTYPLIGIPTFNLQSKEDKIVIIKNISRESAVAIADLIEKENYTTFSNVDVVSADKPSDLKYGWIIYCNCTVS